VATVPLTLDAIPTLPEVLVKKHPVDWLRFKIAYLTGVNARLIRMSDWSPGWWLV
jgi:hypothetical protein